MCTCSSPHCSPGSVAGRLSSGRLAGKSGAGNVGMPVDERAVRIVLPRPDMQRVKGWQPEAVGSLEIMEQLAHELRRTAPMCCVPRVREHQVVSADQLQASAGCRLVKHDLRTTGIKRT